MRHHFIWKRIIWKRIIWKRIIWKRIIWKRIMTIAEQVYELVKSLPEEQASEILTFAELIRAKHLNANQPMSNEVAIPWAELVKSLAGTWETDFPNLEDIRAGLGQDILRESL